MYSTQIIIKSSVLTYLFIHSTLHVTIKQKKLKIYTKLGHLGKVFGMRGVGHLFLHVHNIAEGEIPVRKSYY
jgi:hypothetical protein